MNAEQIEKFQKTIAYRYQDKTKLIQAMTHRSYLNEIKDKAGKQHNERMEFLGDAVLELVVSDYLYHKFDSMVEGKLTKLRAALVCEPSLAVCAKIINVGDYLLLGKGEDCSGGRERESILSDAMEAVIGSIYLDSGYDAAKLFIETHILAYLNDEGMFTDNKTLLQELVQNSYHSELHYRLLKEEGPAHNKQFFVQAMMNDTELETGTGRSKKAAEQEAARKSRMKLLNESISQ